MVQQLQILGEVNNGMEIFKQEAILISDLFPSLAYADVNDLPEIAGDLILLDSNGEFVDSYNIVIRATNDYPYRFPYVFEKGGRIPINIDWHVFADGHCCIKSIPEESLLCKKGIKLDWFIKTQVIPYFFNQKYREMHGFFLKERSHGILGNIEYFVEAFKTQNLETIAQVLYYIKNTKEPNRVSNCFCGSGVKYRKCHREAYRSFSKCTSKELDFYIELVTKAHLIK